MSASALLPDETPRPPPPPTLQHSLPTAENSQKIGSPLITWSEIKDGKLQEVAKTVQEWANAIVNNEENGIAKQWNLFTNKLMNDLSPIFKK